MSARIYFIGGPLDTTSRPLDGEPQEIWRHVEGSEMPFGRKSKIGDPVDWDEIERDLQFKRSMVHQYRLLYQTPITKSYIYEYTGRES